LQVQTLGTRYCFCESAQPITNKALAALFGSLRCEKSAQETENKSLRFVNQEEEMDVTQEDAQINN